MKNIILVDKQDKPIGEASVLDTHLGKGKLHRAFTVILLNKNREFLLTKRSLKKPLWPTFWDGSCSSHPLVNENICKAGIRRCKEELGIKVQKLEDLFNYYYQIRWSNLFSEHEVNHILIGICDGKLNPDLEEVSDYKWLDWKETVKFSNDKKNSIAPWWEIAVEMIEKDNILGKI